MSEASKKHLTIERYVGNCTAFYSHKTDPSGGWVAEEKIDTVQEEENSDDDEDLIPQAPEVSDSRTHQVVTPVAPVPFSLADHLSEHTAAHMASGGSSAAEARASEGLSFPPQAGWGDLQNTDHLNLSNLVAQIATDSSTNYDFSYNPLEAGVGCGYLESAPHDSASMFGYGASAGGAGASAGGAGASGGGAGSSAMGIGAAQQYHDSEAECPYAEMTKAQKQSFFAANYHSLCTDQSNDNFRRFFGKGRGRTPSWKGDFQLW